MVPHNRSLRSDATVGRLVGDHLLRVQLLHVCGCLRFRRPPRALLVSRRARSAVVSLRVLCPRPSTRAASVLDWHTIMLVHVQAVAPGAARRCSYPLQKLPCGRAENPRRPAPFYSCGHLPSSLVSHDTISTPTRTHTERTSSSSNGAPRGSNGAPSGRRRQRRAVHHATHRGHPREGEGSVGGVSE